VINKLKFLLLILIAPLCLAQTGAHRISQVLVKGNSINANVGPFAHILVCVANTGCNTGANIYSDQALTQLITQPLVADGSGNYDYYVAIPGCYDEQISSPGSQDIFIPNVCPFNGTGGANLTAGAVQFAPTVSTTQLPLRILEIYSRELALASLIKTVVVLPLPPLLPDRRFRFRPTSAEASASSLSLLSTPRTMP